MGRNDERLEELGSVCLSHSPQQVKVQLQVGENHGHLHFADLGLRRGHARYSRRRERALPRLFPSLCFPHNHVDYGREERERRLALGTDGRASA